MITLYTQEQFDNAGSRDHLPLQCEHCRNTFLKGKNEILIALAGSTDHKNKYCSKSCSGLSRRLSKLIPCAYCTKTVSRMPKELKKVKNTFCSRKCSAKYNNAVRTRVGFVKLNQVNCEVCDKSYTKCYKKQISCSLVCSAKLAYKRYIEDWKNGKVTGGGCNGDISHRVRTYIFEKYNSKCSRCSWSEVNISTGKIPLNVDHIDGNYANNKEENLTLLCPNCHSLTPTYGSLNKGHGRPYRWRLK